MKLTYEQKLSKKKAADERRRLKLKQNKVKKPKARNSSAIKKSIQALLRKNAIERDGTCVVGQNLALVPQNWHVCGPLRGDGQIIVQAEHLVGRASSASYGDMRNIVLLCMRHHFHFKRQHGAIYWEVIRHHIGPERWALVQQWEKDSWKPTRLYTADWLEIEKDLV